jgi:hypothetical protein
MTQETVRFASANQKQPMKPANAGQKGLGAFGAILLLAIVAVAVKMILGFLAMSQCSERYAGNPAAEQQCIRRQAQWMATSPFQPGHSRAR